MVHLGLAAPTALPDPASWIPRGFLLALILYALNRNITPPLGWDVFRQAHIPGSDVEILGVGRHSATVVFVHGLGGNAAQLTPFVRRLRKHLMQVAFVLPSAKFMPLTLKQGTPIPAWFDVQAFPTNLTAPMPTREDQLGMEMSVQRMHAIIRDQVERKGIDEDRIVLAGFSQGCATALLSAMSYPGKLGGVACLSGWLPLSDKIKRDGNHYRHPLQSDHAHEMPVFWGHGTADPIVLHRWAHESIAHLHRMGFSNVAFHPYEGHVHDMWRPDLEKDLRTWLQDRLPPI
ncbi:hypothetical protein JCM10908_001299 [Rhodotorula pacifica]|uniref:alpha/beta hydrolase n=1 Tax=Rhodotorula pacifica TaxID=1495444 RepID=UPI00317EE175